MELKFIFTVVELQLIFDCSERTAYRYRTQMLEKLGLTSSDKLTRLHVAKYMNMSLAEFDKMYRKSVKMKKRKAKLANQPHSSKISTAS